MNRTFDYNGVQIAPSKPVQKLRTVKKTVYIDSGDRDIIKYPTNGDFVVYLPRVYERVVSLNVRGAEFPNLNVAYTHAGESGNTYSSDSAAIQTSQPFYFLMELNGLNRSDETAPLADRSAYIDSAFAKFQNTERISGSTGPILYNESGGQKNIEYYQPPISKLDRLHLRIRTHEQQTSGTNGFLYWSVGSGSTGIGREFGLTLEIETMENSFDDFSSMETRIGDRS